MRDIFTLLYAIVIIIRLGRPDGLRSVVAESVLMRPQVLILNPGRKRAPNLRASHRIIAGLGILMMGQARVYSEFGFEPNAGPVSSYFFLENIGFSQISYRLFPRESRSTYYVLKGVKNFAPQITE